MKEDGGDGGEGGGGVGRRFAGCRSRKSDVKRYNFVGWYCHGPQWRFAAGGGSRVEEGGGSWSGWRW